MEYKLEYKKKNMRFLFGLFTLTTNKKDACAWLIVKYIKI